MTALSALPVVVPADADWHLRAACRGVDPDTFFLPDAVRGPNKRAREAAAKAICVDCPVINECLGWALTVGEPYGVWGGKTPEERDRLIAANRRVSA